MSFRTGVIVGLAVGYYLGAKAGRERYEQIERYLGPVRDSEPARQLEELARGLVAELLTSTRRALRDATQPDLPESLRRIA
jgi:hypothetical protein